MSEFVSGSPGQMEGRELAGPLRQMQWVVGLGLPPTPTHSLRPVLLASFPHLSPPPASVPWWILLVMGAPCPKSQMVRSGPWHLAYLP